MKKNKNKRSKKAGTIFVEEPTGSAAVITLDGQWSHDFTHHNDNEKAGK